MIQVMSVSTLNVSIAFKDLPSLMQPLHSVGSVRAKLFTTLQQIGFLLYHAVSCQIVSLNTAGPAPLQCLGTKYFMKSGS